MSAELLQDPLFDDEKLPVVRDVASVLGGAAMNRCMSKQLIADDVDDDKAEELVDKAVRTFAGAYGRWGGENDKDASQRQEQKGGRTRKGRVPRPRTDYYGDGERINPTEESVAVAANGADAVRNRLHEIRLGQANTDAEMALIEAQRRARAERQSKLLEKKRKTW